MRQALWIKQVAIEGENQAKPLQIAHSFGCAL
jgi:predicted alpha/beta hydrolase family esterase